MRGKTMKIVNNALFYYIAAALFFCAAVIGFVKDKSYAAMYMCIGGALMCIGSSIIIKARKTGDKDSNDQEK